MTTIAYRAGVLAADSRVTNAGWVASDAAVKVRQLSDKSLVAICGYVAEGEALASWLEAADGSDKPSLDEETGRVVHVRTDGSAWLYEGNSKPYALPDAPFHAWGTGMPSALAAMHMGASAEEAVRIACLVDTHSGGEVRSVRLDSAETLAGQVNGSVNAITPSRFGFADSGDQCA